MDNLRTILFIVGILVIAAVYAWEVFRERRAKMQRLDIFDGDDDLLSQGGNGAYADDSPQNQPLPERAAPEVKDKDNVVVGELDALEGGKKEDASPATDSDLGSDAPPAEKEAASAGDVTSGKTESSSDTKASGPLSYMDSLLPPPEKIRPEKTRPQANTASDKSRSGKATAGKPSTVNPIVIALTIMARPGRRFDGPEIREAVEGAGMESGDIQIFHYFKQDNQETEQLLADPKPSLPIFSAVDILEPGTFPMDDLENYTARGLALFMQLPGPLDGLVAFDLMLGAAQSIAKSLQGELCDDTRSTLTTQVINHLRERIEELKRKQLV